jgi:hypothetical protein
LKDKLRKRVQAQDGTKPVLLKSLRDVLAVRIPVLQNVAQQKANRSLLGFPATALWEVLKPSDAPVIEPTGGFHFMHLLSEHKIESLT